MDRISHLPDETILKIFSYLQTKDIMRTMRLSKRFKSLWMLVPKLEFDDSTHFTESEHFGFSEPDYGSFRRFVDRSIMSSEGQVHQTLYLKIGPRCRDDDIGIWVGIMVKRGLMELKFENTSSYCRHGHLPKSLYTCATLVFLILEGAVFNVPDLVSLPSLKTLSLKFMKFSDSSCLLRLLSNCPVLEDLFVEQSQYNHVEMSFKIVMPSLKRLSLLESPRGFGIKGLVLDVPFLKYLHIVDLSGHFSCSESINTNEVVKADVEVILSQPEKLLPSLTSVEHIRLCLSASEVVYPIGCFHRLKHLEVCTCKTEWLDLFMHILQNSPSLKVIKINQWHNVTKLRPSWNEPSIVPECLSSNLETFEWIKYEGTEGEKELSTYILKNAGCLKMASFTPKSTDPKRKLQMLRDLSLSRRVSSNCELVFN